MMSILSDIALPGTNSDCVSEMISWSIGLSLRERIFVMILYETLHRAIGRYSDTNLAPVTLGINRTCVEFEAGDIYPVLKKLCISEIKAGPIVLQLEWKKLAEKSSGPGALSE